MPARKQTKSASFVLVSGSDEAEVKRVAMSFAAKMAPSDDPFATEIIDGAAGNADESVSRIHKAIEAILTVPFFGNAKLVWLKNASFLSDTVTGRSESVAQAMEKLLAVIARGLPDGVRLLMSVPEPDKRRSSYKQLSQAAESVVCDKPDFGWGATEQDVLEWVGRRAQSARLRLSDEALEILAARTGAETRQLDSEIEKLTVAFGAGPEITAENVRDLVPATRTGGIFDLGNAIARRQLSPCLASLSQLLRQREKSMSILLAAIVPTVRNLLLAKDLLAQEKLAPPAQPNAFAATLKRLPETATAHLPRKKDGAINAYALGLAAVNSRRYSLPELQSAILACARANVDLVTTQMAESIVLARLLVEIVSKPEPPVRP